MDSINLLAVVQDERKKKWDEKNQEAIAKAVQAQDEFAQVVKYLTISCLVVIVMLACSQVFSSLRRSLLYFFFG